MIHTVMHKSAPLISKGSTFFTTRWERLKPLQEQEKLFMQLLERGAGTRFGMDHGFAGLTGLPFRRAYERYRQQVPIRSYADYWREYFNHHYHRQEGRGMLQLQDVTWPGTIPFFCETSGTTAPTKYIPFSREMFAANKRAAFDLTAAYLARNPGSRLLGGKLLYMSGSTELTRMGEGVLSGDMSAITLSHAPTLLKPFIAPSLAVASLPWEQKLDAMARLLLSNPDIRGISGVPPWILLLLNRCRELGGGDMCDLLPELELIIHGGTSLKPYRREFTTLFSDRPPHFLELLPSSEAFMAFQLLGESHMRFTPYYGVFFEFVPFAELDEKGFPSPSARAIPLEEVVAGERYAVILSTCAGLWRYHIGDTVRFVSLEPMMIEFTGRDRFLDRFEEKVTQEEVEEAIASLNEMDGVEIKEFLVGPDIAARRHVWVLAVGGERPIAPGRLGHYLDSRLRMLNADYSTFRNQERIEEPKIYTVDEELIYQWSREVRGKLGGQSKIPHIDPTVDGEMIQSLLNFIADNHSVAV